MLSAYFKARIVDSHVLDVATTSEYAVYFWKQHVWNFPEENWSVPVGFDQEEISVEENSSYQVY